MFYQAMSGALYLVYGGYSTMLEYCQIEELHIDKKQIDNFNAEHFDMFYKLRKIA